MLPRLWLCVWMTACAAREHLRTGDDWMERGNYEAAARAYTRADEARPGHPRTLARLAHARVAAGLYADAVGPAWTALDAGVESARADLARALLECGSAPEALALTTGPADPALAAALAQVRGEALLALGQPAAAQEPLRVALAAGVPTARVWLAWAQGRAGDSAGAVETLAPLAGDPALPTELLALAAGVPLAWAAPEPALALAQEALSLDAGLKAPEGWADRALAEAQRLLELGDRERALLLGSAAWALRANDGTVGRQVGPWWLADGGVSQAALVLERALQSPPFTLDQGGAFTHVSTQAPLSEAEVRAGRVELATALAEVRRQQGDPLGELRALQLSIDAGSPDRAAQLWRQTELLYSIDEPSRAWAAWQEAARAGSLEATLRLIDNHQQARRLDQAVSWGLTGWRNHPGDPAIALALAGAYTARGDRSAAQQVLREALSLHPDHAALQAAAAQLAAPVYTPLPELFRPQ